jgi:hypothetical protein
MQNLRTIIDKFGSDKNLSGYTEVYEELFKYIRNIELDILEIGIGTLSNGISNMRGTQIKDYKQGASLRVWKEWFIQSNIYGMDIQEDCMFEEDRIRTFLCSSVDKEEVDRVLDNKRFNIIIDDGWHDVEAQKMTFNSMWDRVIDGGIYIIEDIERGINSSIHSFIINKELNYNTNGYGNLIWIHK